MLRYPEGGEESVVSVNEITAAHHVRLASTLVDREEVLLLVGKVMDEALKPESPSSEKDRSDALLFCHDPHGKMILTEEFRKIYPWSQQKSRAILSCQ